MFSVVIALKPREVPRSMNKGGNDDESATCWYKCLTNRGDFSFCGDVNARGWQRAPAARLQRRTFEHGPDFLRSASRWFTAARAHRVPLFSSLFAWRAPETNPRPPVGGVAAPRNSFAARYGCIRVFLLHLFLLLIQHTSTMARSGRQREGIRERNLWPLGNKYRLDQYSLESHNSTLYLVAWMSMRIFIYLT